MTSEITLKSATIGELNDPWEDNLLGHTERPKSVNNRYLEVFYAIKLYLN